MTLRRVALLLAATLAIGTGVAFGAAFAATLDVGSDHLWAGTQTLTKGSCTLSGTSSTTDTYVWQGSPSSSYGSGTTLLVQPNSGSQEWTLVQFDLSSCEIPATGGADSATLNLTITSAPKSSRTLTVTPVLSSWSGSTTWNGAQSLSYGSSPTTTFATGSTTGATVSIPVTVDVDALIKGASSYGWRISDGGASASHDTTTFASSNASSGKPQLVIDYEK